MKSKATVICSGEPIYEEDAEFDLIFPEFNQYFVGAMSTIDNIRSNDNREYMLNIIGKIGGKDAVNFIKEEKSFRKEDWGQLLGVKTPSLSFNRQQCYPEVITF